MHLSTPHTGTQLPRETGNTYLQYTKDAIGTRQKNVNPLANAAQRMQAADGRFNALALAHLARKREKKERRRSSDQQQWLMVCSVTFAFAFSVSVLRLAPLLPAHTPICTATCVD